MCREDPERYERYQALKIPQSVEHDWEQENFDDYAQQTLAMTQSNDIAQAHSHLIGLAFNLRQHDVIARVVDITHAIAGKLTTPLSKLVVAENLIGRASDQKDGAICVAHQAGLRELAQELIDAVFSLVSSAKSQQRLLERCDCANRDTQRLANCLGLTCETKQEDDTQAIVYLVNPKQEQKLVDPTIFEVSEKIQSLEWMNGASVMLQRLPARQLSIDRIIIEGIVPVNDLATERFEVCWCHAKNNSCFIRAKVASLDLVNNILAAAIDNDEAKLREMANWCWPPALKPG